MRLNFLRVTVQDPGGLVVRHSPGHPPPHLIPTTLTPGSSLQREGGISATVVVPTRGGATSHYLQPPGAPPLWATSALPPWGRAGPPSAGSPGSARADCSPPTTTPSTGRHRPEVLSQQPAAPSPLPPSPPPLSQRPTGTQASNALDRELSQSAYLYHTHDMMLGLTAATSKQVQTPHTVCL